MGNLFANGIRCYRTFEYYFNVDVYDFSARDSDERRLALADGYVHGLHQASALDAIIDASIGFDRIAYSIRHVCTQSSTSCVEVATICASALAYLNADKSDFPVRESTTAFLVGYQVAFLTAKKYNPAIFMKGQDLLEYVYGELILDDRERLSVTEAGRTAYQRNLAVLQEDLPPGERA